MCVWRGGTLFKELNRLWVSPPPFCFSRDHLIGATVGGVAPWKRANVQMFLQGAASDWQTILRGALRLRVLRTGPHPL